jgi:hypothetical protein
VLLFVEDIFEDKVEFYGVLEDMAGGTLGKYHEIEKATNSRFQGFFDSLS